VARVMELGVALTKLFDWELEHPIIIASGPFSNDLNSINAMFSYGAAAVVTKTITMHPGGNNGCLKYRDSVFNRDGYSSNNLEQWNLYLENLRGKKVISNIFSETPEGLAQLARLVVSHGIEVIELGLSCPTFGSDPICFYPERLKEYCMAVRKSVNIPILVKVLLSTSRNKNRDMVDCIKNCGVNGVSISDSLPAIILNENDGNLKLGGTGGLSGPVIKPLVLKSLYDISDIGLTTIGIGGVETTQDIIDYIRMGAVAVQICSCIIKNRVSSIGTLRNDLIGYLEEKNISMKEIHRKAL
jgi:dihydroorotate dehydrogenase (fumarate)/dihydroorotate dehydrogenase (NAD+) catalytic subunit